MSAFDGLAFNMTWMVRKEIRDGMVGGKSKGSISGEIGMATRV